MAAMADTAEPLVFTKEQIEARPWKYIGYEGYSSFISSDDDLFIFRRFSALTARVLLSLQDEIVQLEERLNALELELRGPSGPEIKNGSFREEACENRRVLVAQAHEKLKAYNDLLLQHSELRAKPKVRRKNIASLDNWHWNHPTAVDEPEAAYIQHKHDLVALHSKVHDPLRVWLEQWQSFRLLSWWKKPAKPGAAGLAGLHGIADQHVHYVGGSRIDIFVSAVVISVGLVMLIAPLWTLAYVQGTATRLGVITAFVVVFVAMLSSTTAARSFESLGAAAAYAAVLVVFLQGI